MQAEGYLRAVPFPQLHACNEVRAALRATKATCVAHFAVYAGFEALARAERCCSIREF